MIRMVTVTFWCFKMPDQVGHDDNVTPDQVGHDDNVIAGLTGNLE